MIAGPGGEHAAQALEASAPARGARRAPRWRRAVPALVVGVATSALAAELGFRFLLFGESGLARRWGEDLRQAGFFADPNADDDFWKLQRLFTDKRPVDATVHRDPRIGWLKKTLDPADYGHAAEGTLGGRRPVLMYGDSFTACVVPSKHCWEGLLEESPRGAELALVNYGTHAYGLDQIYLLMQASLERWVGRDPLVVVGVLVDNSLDRCLLSFRECPKPRFRLRDGELAFEPPVELGVDEYIAENPPHIPSYLWRYLSVRAPWWPEGMRPMRGEHPELVREKQELTRELVLRIQAELEARGFEHFFLLFHEPASARVPEPYGWREVFLVELLSERGIPWVSSKRAIQQDAATTGRKERAYFLQDGMIKGHLSRNGNRAVFPALLAGLGGEFDGPVPR